ncbi:HAAS domain-containing protein [Companilactobacillus nuruki]|uniref:DUF1700 domain-containing protein n=1 Tax=Companilactobacillus nuruki TaxID=1993540 RepID=A0A2N7AR47_9LACO|nr:DUF1700 domain-containing protein [Companilactobacillus nuruki]PMD67827.1 hypothetical protein CBP76_12945 [Companilactobacillus nuruki]
MMDKTGFLIDLEKDLKKYGVSNSDDYIEYYSEYLDDLIENGMSSEAAVNSVGGVKKILLNILSDEKVKIPKVKNRLQRIILLSASFPIWGPIVAALYIIALAIVFSLIICALAFMAAGLWTFLGSFIVIFKIGFTYALLQFGISLILLGLGILFEQFLIGFSGAIYNLNRSLFKKFSSRGIEA